MVAKTLFILFLLHVCGRLKSVQPQPMHHIGFSHLIIISSSKINGKGAEICIALHRKKLTSEALWFGSHSFYTANTPYLPNGIWCQRWHSMYHPGGDQEDTL